LNLPLAFTNAFGTLLAVFFIDRLGRRYIMLRALPGVVFSCILVSVSFYLSKFTDGKS
jgi:predicted MFS family arabinose efflux permease